MSRASNQVLIRRPRQWDQGRRDLHALAAREVLLIPWIRLQMRTLRLLKIDPTWSNYVATPEGWMVEKETDAATIDKIAAWWELVYNVARDDKDRNSVVLACLYVLNEKQRRGGGKEFPVNCKRWGVSEDRARVVLDTVKRLFGRLHPSDDIAPETRPTALTTLKVEPITKKQAFGEDL